jgi:CRISPR system Cascade subunit CasA
MLDESFAPQGRDSMMAWQLLTKSQEHSNPWVPVSFQEERAVWRDAHSLFGSFDQQSIRPPILDWISELTEEVVDEDQRYALDVAGLCTFQAKVLSWHTEALPMPLMILKQPGLMGQVKKAMEAAEGGAAALRFGARRLAERMLAPLSTLDGKQRSADRDSATRLSAALLRLQHYWAGLELAFQKFVVDLGKGGTASIDLDTGLTPALKAWMDACRAAALETMELTCRAAGAGERTFRAVAEAERTFRHMLDQRLGGSANEKETTV